MAALYHWTPRKLESELTDEQLVLLLDEQADVVQDRWRGEFERMVEAVRAGTIFAHDGKQHSKWIRSLRQASGQSRALVGESLERHVATLAFGRPDLVKRVPA